MYYSGETRQKEPPMADTDYTTDGWYIGILDDHAATDDLGPGTFAAAYASARRLFTHDWVTAVILYHPSNPTVAYEIMANGWHKRLDAFVTHPEVPVFA